MLPRSRILPLHMLTACCSVCNFDVGLRGQCNISAWNVCVLVSDQLHGTSRQCLRLGCGLEEPERPLDVLLGTPASHPCHDST